MPSTSARGAPASYRPRDPEKSLWNRTLRDHLHTFFEGARDADAPDSGVPLFVERELREAVSCGWLSGGFIRFRCADCAEEKIVAFSCGARAACPSCGARRMHESAANLVDRVLPDVPIRQFVITAPWVLRVLLLSDADFLRAFIRISVSTIFRHARARAGALAGQGGAVVVVQRFSSTLAAYPHLHILVLDGAYTKSGDDPPVFHVATGWTERDEYAISATICQRMERLLRSRGLIDPDAGVDREPTPLERWFAKALEARARLALVEGDGHVLPSGRSMGRATESSTGDVAGFSVNARTAVRAGDKAGRERLAKYCLRPPFAESQLSATCDARIALALKTPRRYGETHVVLDPVALIRRVAYLVPPPRRHSVSYAGCLAPAAKLRPEVIPAPVLELEVRGPPEGTPPNAEGPGIAARATRIAWAKLLQRVYELDVLDCPRCGGHLRPIAAITQPTVIRAILEHLGLPADPPQLKPARAPP